ncbi:amidase [Patulibacter defluvii]|uniref:amidase n=1 Tax=Patulibacter defluvii TaxID=3095358 RepID=UPI002A758D1C|nr:amidase [Patulibacter sp. DM4]
MSTTTTTAAPATAGLAAQAAALAAGQTSSRALVDTALARIAETQPTLNAFRAVLADSARAAADEADRRLAAGERAPLLGVPVAVKDDTDIAGEETRFGCAGPFPAATADAELVVRLRAAGAVIVGKTTTPEIGQWPITVGDGFGITRNPWNPAYTPGGSSGGSAAAVAAGIVAAAVGSDGAGSVRIPAAWTHLVGIKPQRGRISTWPDAEAFHGLTVHGPLARTVGDAALLLDVLTGNHPGELHQPPAPDEPYAIAATRDPGRLRIGLALNAPWVATHRRLDPEIRREVLRLGQVLRDLGHEVVERTIPYGPVGPIFMPRSMNGVRQWVQRLPREAAIDHRTRENARTGLVLSGPTLRFARRVEAAYQRWVGRSFRDCDVLLAPTTANAPLAVEAIDGLTNFQTDQVVAGACPYSYPWNVLGWPGINVPAGFTGAGLPIGATLLGPENGESRLISLAAQLETVERWHERWPG